MERASTPPSPRQAQSWLGRVCLALLLGLAWPVLAAAPSKPDPAGLNLEAKFTIELASYIRYPKMKDPATPFVLAVVGESPFSDELEVYAKGQTIQGRRIQIRYYQRVPEGQPCDLLFICRSEWPRADSILAWCKGKGILTVAEGEQLAYKGVMVNLFVEANRLRLGLNLRALEGEGFNLGANVLQVARVLVAPKSAR